MADNQAIKKYFNSLLGDLEKSFWDERGTGMRYRTVTVGSSYLREKQADLNGISTIEQAVAYVREMLLGDRLVTEFRYETDPDFSHAINLQVRECVHREKERQLIESGVETLTCPILNILRQVMEDTCAVTNELVSVEVEETTCSLKIVLMDWIKKI